MKTNYQRNFHETRRKLGDKKTTEYVRFYEERLLALSDKAVYVAVTHQDGHPHNGFARARKGAKRFLNSQERRLEKIALKRIVKDIDL